MAKNYDKYKKTCEELREAPIYKSRKDKNRALLNLLAHSQFLAFKLIVPYIAGTAKKMKMSREDFSRDIEVVTDRFCSPYLTIASKKTLQNALMGNFDLEESFVAGESSTDYVSALKLFGDFCSWKSNRDSVNILTYYLKDDLWGNLVVDDYVNAPHKALCLDNGCRIANDETFKNLYSYAINKPSFQGELKSLWCQDIKNIDFEKESVSDYYSQIRLKLHPDQLKVSKLNLYAVMTGTPSPVALENWNSNMNYFYSRLVQEEKEWSKFLIKKMSQKLVYEEPVDLSFYPMENFHKLSEMKLNFNIVSGEFDRVINGVDKFTWKLNANLKVKYLKWLYFELERINFKFFHEKDELTEKLKKELAIKLKSSLENYASQVFALKRLEGDLYERLAGGVIEQLKKYQGSKIDFLDEEKILNIPVNFSFGFFALQKLAELRGVGVN